MFTFPSVPRYRSAFTFPSVSRYRSAFTFPCVSRYRPAFTFPSVCAGDVNALHIALDEAGTEDKAGGVFCVDNLRVSAVWLWMCVLYWSEADLHALSESLKLDYQTQQRARALCLHLSRVQANLIVILMMACICHTLMLI